MSGLPTGVLLRRMRLDSGMSLAELARRAFVSKGYLSKIENGLSVPSESVVRQCDAALGAGGRLVTAAATAGSARVVAAHPGAGVDLGDIGDLDDPLLGAGGLGLPSPLPFGLGSTQDLTSLLAPIGRASLGGDSAAVADTFAEMFGGLRQLGQQVSPMVVLPVLVTQTHVLRALAGEGGGGGEAGGTARTELRLLSSRYAEYTGWMAQEAGEIAATLRWTAAAVRLAAAAGDAELAAFALVRRGLVALYAGDAHRAIELSRRAAAHPAVSDRVRGLAAQQEAQGHALAGDRAACERTLDRAAALLSSAPPGLGGSTVTNPVALVRAWCLHDLGDVAAAARAFDALLPGVPSTARRFRARWSTRHALALASAGELDHACALAPSIAADQAAIDSATVRVDVAALARVLARHSTHRPAREAHAALTAVLRHGVA